MIVIQVFYVVFLLYMWFETDGFVEYSRLFGLSKKFRIDLWEQYREINPRLDYFGYIRLKHSSFLIRLITCRQCLCFWLALFSCLAFSDIFLLPVVYVLSYLIYRLICRYAK